MSELIVSRQQRVLLLTLNRPAARNALNNALLMQLVNELEAAATDTSISVLSLIHISEPTRQAEISYAVFCLKKKKRAAAPPEE